MANIYAVRFPGSRMEEVIGTSLDDAREYVIGMAGRKDKNVLIFTIDPVTGREDDFARMIHTAHGWVYVKGGYKWAVASNGSLVSGTKKRIIVVH